MIWYRNNKQGEIRICEEIVNRMSEAFFGKGPCGKRSQSAVSGRRLGEQWQPAPADCRFCTARRGICLS